MGRLAGRRPDPTPGIARAARRHLGDGERVLAGVYVQRPGTMGAEMSTAASAAVGATMGLPPRFPDDDLEPWLAAAAAVDVDADTARRTIHIALALTSSRLLLLRRSRLTRRPKEPIAAWPLAEVDRIEVPRNGSNLKIHSAGRELELELPLAHKFLPDVYRELPQRLADAQAALGQA